MNNITAYWDERALGYSKSSVEELSDETKHKWQQYLLHYIPAGQQLKCLDLGCGPGFLALLLQEMGHTVYGVDTSESMIEHANANAVTKGLTIDFSVMDAQSLQFDSDTFDFIVTRNVTWNLSSPEQAYDEWLRVLKPGGRFLNFDGNHYLHLFDDRYANFRKSNVYEDPHQTVHLKGINTNTIEEIARQQPLSSVERPAWDLAFFQDQSVKIIDVQTTPITFTNDSLETETVIDRFHLCVEKF
ncbi:class I SAM-dependent methyltransferase [Geomicrobium sediminis]|uniref:Ubiquinone/menaquinone biosynthesis C-methylase UbiE n=1 Tax=Geomicrobium sediminis TaxID=1347788 RepID=A0ABS2PC95_9BACL|nr:class I SAM-dependent methyltransferase [Geomicrobium sediminis]MBM7633049.1 ubiquinone/menaquinone biosynthesis C-methylase UbiE [Geomicrobium sediminis]